MQNDAAPDNPYVQNPRFVFNNQEKRLENAYMAENKSRTNTMRGKYETLNPKRGICSTLPWHWFVEFWNVSPVHTLHPVLVHRVHVLPKSVPSLHTVSWVGVHAENWYWPLFVSQTVQSVRVCINMCVCVCV